MPAKFLIEVAHDANSIACARVVDVFLKSGSHFLSRADWGCRDGAHRAWMIVSVDSREDAERIVPPGMRSRAKIVRLNCFSVEEIDDILREHRA